MATDLNENERNILDLLAEDGGSGSFTDEYLKDINTLVEKKLIIIRARKQIKFEQIDCELIQTVGTE